MIRLYRTGCHIKSTVSDILHTICAKLKGLIALHLLDLWYNQTTNTRNYTKDNLMTKTSNKLKTFIAFKHDTLLLGTVGETITFPQSTSDLNPFSNYNPFLIKRSTETDYYLVDLPKDFPQLDDFDFITMRDFRDFHAQTIYPTVAASYQLLNWNRQHQYCGVCGTKFGPMNPDRSRPCPECSNLLFPQTSVAVITGIIKDGKLLLAHNANFPEGLYSLIAGFVELGENFEETVAREIQEEVGLNVKNIRYFGNQPWPFPNSTMVGYLADYESGDIKVDGVEIVDAHWYTPDTFPSIPSKSSIARKIIDYYCEHIAPK